MTMSQKRSRREYERDLARKQEAPFVVYGTPLPLLDDNARDDGSYVPIWKQEVTDERGRKRLHGAFTGGFSAGYFNTVGSKEGWTPSTFVSSRSNRAKDTQDARQQRVEDFMDEEDLREQDESRQLSTNPGFAGFGTADDAGVRNVLDDLFHPADDTMGEQLLNRMGWKKGQGIGPRVRRKIDPGDPLSEEREFPPEDSSMLQYPQKHDTKGLGLGNDAALSRPTTAAKAVTPRDANEESDDDDTTRPGLSFMSRPKKKTEKLGRSGIGVGPLNDTGSDDEDPYEMGPRMSFNRVIGGDKKKIKKPKTTTTTSNANPLLKQKPTFVSKSKQLPSVLSSLRKCHDGKLPLTGFVLVDELNSFSALQLSDDKYKPPEVPQDWQPSRVPADQPSSSSATLSMTRSERQQQTAESRRALLGEQSLPSKSVFDYLSPAARDRLAAATGKSNLPPALNEAPPTQANSSTSPGAGSPGPAYPVLDATTATTALLRLRKDKAPPYNDDLSKQTRYKDFLRYSADPLPPGQRVPPLRAPQHKFSDADHLAELAEFAATAELFKPATGFLASRFTSAASSTSESVQTGEGPDGDGGKDELLRKPAEKPKDPAEEAAKMGMFGLATQSIRSWQPTRLVCKRFGVDMPVSWNED